MSERKTMILGIAPYIGLKTLLESAAAEHAEIEMDVFSGDRQDGLKLALDMPLEKYDAIISRGATAELLMQAVDLPVIEVGISGSDILHSMKLAENYSGRYAIVSFPSLVRNAQFLCDLLQYHIDIYTWEKAEDIEPLLEMLQRNNYDMVLCDTIVDTLAKQRNFNSILIASGIESVESAISQAVKNCKTYRQLREQRDISKSLLQNGDTEIVAFDKTGGCVFSSLHTLDRKTLDSLFTRIINGPNAGSEVVKKEIGDYLATINAKKISCGKETYQAFYLDFHPLPQNRKRSKIAYYNRSEAADRFLKHFHGLPLRSPDGPPSVKELGLLKSPLFLFGEVGTGKLQTAAGIYCSGPLQKHPFILIDAEALSDKSLHYLSSNSNSPFFENNITFCIYGLETLSREQLAAAATILHGTGLHRRNRVFFCYTTMPGQPLPEEAVSFADHFTCASLRLSPLRERPDEISTLACLYMATYNLELARQAIGFEPDALQLLQQYSWPQNLRQFRQAIRQMMLLSPTVHISAEVVQNVLSEGQMEEAAEPATRVNINLDRTLSEINSDIARLVIRQCNGNQTQAAKQLGISRTTLWRMVNK